MPDIFCVKDFTYIILKSVEFCCSQLNEYFWHKITWFLPPWLLNSFHVILALRAKIVADKNQRGKKKRREKITTPPQLLRQFLWGTGIELIGLQRWSWEGVQSWCWLPWKQWSALGECWLPGNWERSLYLKLYQLFQVPMEVRFLPS